MLYIFLSIPLLFINENISSSEFFNFLLNNAVGLSILFIFLSALFGFFVKARSVDKCLKDFNYFSVTVEIDDSSIYKGAMNLYHTGMELSFRQRDDHNKNYSKYSRILYETEYPKIKCVYRYQNELTDVNKAKRKKSIKKTYKPGLIRRALRKLRNILGTFRDAISQSFHLILGQLKQTKLKQQNKHLKNIGESLVEYSGNIYDPILENFIGRHIVIETLEKKEYFGIFKEYSKNYLQLLNVQTYETNDYKIATKVPQLTANKNDVYVSRSKKNIIIKNLENFPLYVSRVGVLNDFISVDRIIEPQKKIQIPIKEVPVTEEDVITIEFMNIADVIIPRAIAFVRFCADEKKITWKEALKTDFQSVWQVAMLKNKS
ncbi:hypothetical protein [Candidatus Uabimicrobium sp. HlEnr_7]|uniref:hypothetical protein n=1 Tax=Candidatus Uabimicrobium helgolandensis TaxID=3095367 RepID=UPI003557ED65